MAGHDLAIEVTSWRATVEVGEDGVPTGIELEADPGSLRVREGSGGAQKLGEEDMSGIDETIAKEVLPVDPIEFRSTAIEAAGEGGPLSVRGDLALAGNSNPVEFELDVGAGGQITGSASIKQSDWGIKPYSALFGTLKVLDEVEVEVEAALS
jgi:hypothetical protein